MNCPLGMKTPDCSKICGDICRATDEGFKMFVERSERHKPRGKRHNRIKSPNLLLEMHVSKKDEKKVERTARWSAAEIKLWKEMQETGRDKEILERINGWRS